MRPTLAFLILATVAAAPGLYAQSKKGPPAKDAATPSTALKVPVDVARSFVPSGYMGDGELGNQYARVTPVAGAMCRSGNVPCIKVSYQRGSKGWAGVYWLHPANNWGTSPGRQIEGAEKITFWAAGEKGGEIVEFKAGGILDKPHSDSFEVTLGSVALSKEWKQYEIPLAGQSLKNVVGAFAWVATADANPKGLTFYLDAIRYE
jgi:hypothetical protein